jgi:hypothetical protein
MNIVKAIALYIEIRYVKREIAATERALKLAQEAADRVYEEAAKNAPTAEQLRERFRDDAQANKRQQEYWGLNRFHYYFSNRSRPSR